MRGSPGLAHPFTPRSVRVGGRWAQLPVSGWGAFSFHCVCLSFPGAPLPGEGPCMSGGPQPPKPSVSLSLCCLFKIWCPDPHSHRECQQTNPSCPPRHTYLCLSLLFTKTPRLADPPTAAAINARINTRGSHSAWDSCPLWDWGAGLGSDKCCSVQTRSLAG